MKVKAYKKGRKYEYELVKEARENGQIAFRSAGSHSPIDVVVIDEQYKIIYFIQCKNSKTSYKKLAKKFNKSLYNYRIIWKVMEREDLKRRKT